MKILLLCSGGDAPGMNRFIYDIFKEFPNETYYAAAGFDGLINGRIYPLKKVVKEEDKNKAGVVIKTSRCPEFKERKYFKVGLENAKKFDFVVICGGNGSERGAKELYENGVRALFVPGTIDNDVADNYYSLGFSTAVKECVYAVQNVMPSIEAMNRACLFEIMGRECSQIAAKTAKIVKADYVAKDKIEYEKIVDAILRKHEKGKSATILIRENLEDIEKVAKTLNKMLGLDIVRFHIVGRTQRGGAPTKEEIEMADKFAAATVKAIKKGQAGRVLANRNLKVEIKDFI